MSIQMKQLRVRKGLKQSEVAKRLNMPTRRYGSYEREERAISLIDAARVADVLECTLDELAGRDFQPNDNSLTSDESNLVGIFRESNAQGKASIMAVAQAQPGIGTVSERRTSKVDSGRSA